MIRTQSLTTVLILLLHSFALHAAPEFPKLSGRIVDEANLLSSESKNNLSSALEQHEKETSNQVVIVTLNSLQGHSIEEYGYQLGRHWSIGQKQINNGVLLIVAPKERKVRIEVGYGLEGTLTDALSSTIIHNEILPKFRKGQFETGILLGSQAILNGLSGNYKAPTKARAKTPSRLLRGSGSNSLTDLNNLFIIAIIAIAVFTKILVSMSPSPTLFGLGLTSIFAFGLWYFTGSVLTAVVIGLILFAILVGGGGGGNGDSHRSYRRSSSFSGGSRSFGGGGGSFGGGGASGGW